MGLNIRQFNRSETEEKIKAMENIGININDFVEWAILNFDIEIYQQVMKGTYGRRTTAE